MNRKLLVTLAAGAISVATVGGVAYANNNLSIQDHSSSTNNKLVNVNNDQNNSNTNLPDGSDRPGGPGVGYPPVIPNPKPKDNLEKFPGWGNLEEMPGWENDNLEKFPKITPDPKTPKDGDHKSPKNPETPNKSGSGKGNKVTRKHETLRGIKTGNDFNNNKVTVLTFSALVAGVGLITFSNRKKFLKS